jgi:hypothetical protein
MLIRITISASIQRRAPQSVQKKRQGGVKTPTRAHDDTYSSPFDRLLREATNG